VLQTQPSELPDELRDRIYNILQSHNSGKSTKKDKVSPGTVVRFENQVELADVRANAAPGSVRSEARFMHTLTATRSLFTITYEN
jgi:hypothetical protein